jgi:hypothetical protein
MGKHVHGPVMIVYKPGASLSSHPDKIILISDDDDYVIMPNESIEMCLKYRKGGYN